ncbi:peptidoglycan recognition protein family protein [Segnochrobactraceae bacterium EtOH-i3]
MTFTRPDRMVSRVFIHCSASDRPEHDDVAVMRQWHRANGWADVGYHFFIRKDGLVQAGRSLELVPAAQAGHNTGSLAICLHGLDKGRFTEAQFTSLRGLAAEIDAAYRGAVTFHGHCEVSAKACPVFDYRAVLGLDSSGRLSRGVSSPAAIAGADGDATVRGVLRYETRRDADPEEVRALQVLVNAVIAAGHAPPGVAPLTVDGDYGARTEAAVRAIQSAHGLIPDGITGPLTWEVLDRLA